MKKVMITNVYFKVIGVYEDKSEDMFEEFKTYEEAEKYIKTTDYVVEEFRIDKVFRRELASK